MRCLKLCTVGGNAACPSLPKLLTCLSPAKCSPEMHPSVNKHKQKPMDLEQSRRKPPWSYTLLGQQGWRVGAAVTQLWVRLSREPSVCTWLKVCEVHLAGERFCPGSSTGLGGVLQEAGPQAAAAESLPRHFPSAIQEAEALLTAFSSLGPSVTQPRQQGQAAAFKQLFDLPGPAGSWLKDRPSGSQQ